MIYYFLIAFWFVGQIKACLFWLYLWQLKEYHLGRFVDHFRTEKGKRLLLSPLMFLKIAMVFVLLLLGHVYLWPGFYDIIADFILILSLLLFFIVYLFEAVRTVSNYVSNKLLKPVFTRKIQFLGLVVLILNFCFLSWALRFSRRPLFDLLVFDIFTPLIVSSVVLIFQPLAAIWRLRVIKKATQKREGLKDLLVIGITGSYGKTSMKELLACILKKRYKVLKTQEHQNSEIGISNCVLNDLKREHEVFICEMGAYNRGGIKLLCDIVKPKIGVLTGINEQHMALFGSQDNIIKAKFELIKSLPKDGTAFFNGKNKYCLELYEKTKIKKRLYGQKTKIAGLENLEGAKAVAKELGMTEQEVSTACEELKDGLPGVKIKKGRNSLDVIDASYSANPHGVIAHLDYLKTQRGKKIIIMPCLIELGSASKRVHKEIGKKIAGVCDWAIITTKDRFKEIKEGAAEKGMKAEDIFFIENPEIIFEKVKILSSPGDIILLEGRVPQSLIKKLIIN